MINGGTELELIRWLLAENIRTSRVRLVKRQDLACLSIKVCIYYSRYISSRSRWRFLNIPPPGPPSLSRRSTVR